MTLSLAHGAAAATVLARLRELVVDDALVVGLGEPLVRAAGKVVPGLRTFPALCGPGPAIPATQGALFLHARGDDHGHTLRALRRVLAQLADHVRVEEDVVGFVHDIGRDLSGFEDGTENPKGDAAQRAAIVSGRGDGLDGGSFVAAQRWVHDLARLEAMDARTRDALIGRELETNDELADAPPSAHVKRAQQEGFEPPAFMVRRSLPYGSVGEHGLYFVAYVAALDDFERVLARMAGVDDGVVDGLFEFSRPVSGGYYWCPPVRGAHLDLRALA